MYKKTQYIWGLVLSVVSGARWGLWNIIPTEKRYYHPSKMFILGHAGRKHVRVIIRGCFVFFNVGVWSPYTSLGIFSSIKKKSEMCLWRRRLFRRVTALTCRRAFTGGNLLPQTPQKFQWLAAVLPSGWGHPGGCSYVRNWVLGMMGHLLPVSLSLGVFNVVPAWSLSPW